MRGIFKSNARAILAGLIGIAALAFADMRPVSAQGPAPIFPWADPELVRAARAEAGSVTVYSSVNEQEALPFWKLFEDATGIKVEYVRAGDVVLIGRIAIEQRARQRSWDLLLSPAVGRLPRDFMQPIDLSEAKNLMPQARDPDRRWYGVYANYDVPSYNSKLANASELPASYEEFLNHREWAGRCFPHGCGAAIVSMLAKERHAQATLSRHRALGRGEIAGEQPEERRLAGAVSAHDAPSLTGGNCKGDVLEQGGGAELHCRPANRYLRHARALFSSRRVTTRASSSMLFRPRRSSARCHAARAAS